jgi:hypothetical protein
MVNPFRTSNTSKRRVGLFAAGILSPVVGMLVLGAVLVGSRGATAADCDGPPPDGTYRNVTIEGRVVPVIRVKENGAMVLVDTDGKLPRTWEELYKQHGDLPSGTYNLHKTAPNGSDNFAEVPVDRKGTWTIDVKGNITAR